MDRPASALAMMPEKYEADQMSVNQSKYAGRDDSSAAQAAPLGGLGDNLGNFDLAVTVCRVYFPTTADSYTTMYNYQALKGQDLHYSKEEEGKIVRKIDWRLMPLCAWATGLQYVDKSALGAAATYGMREDIHLVGQEYSWCVTMFYFGYLIGTPIMARIMQKYHAGKVIGIAYFIWGATLLGMLGVHNFAGVMALRFLLGFFESALVPGLLLITTMWYTTTEMPFRFGLWTLTCGLLPVPALIIYYGLGHVGTDSLPSWRLIFLLLGLLSVLTGGLIIWALPDNPTTVKWLSPREKAVAVKRLEKSQTGVKNTSFKWEQVREAATDLRCWLMVLQMLFSQAAGNVTTNFLGIVIKGFGYTALKAQLYTAPNFAVQTVMVVLATAPPTFIPWFANKKQLLVAFYSLFAIAGIIILFVSEPTLATQRQRLAGCIILSTSSPNYTQVMIVIGCNVAGFTKKQIVTSAAFVAYCIINICTPQTFLGRESPTYHTGLSFVLAMLSAFVLACVVNHVLMIRENRRRDKLALSDPANYGVGDANPDELSGLRDHTDKQNLHLRYLG